jgi:hypothetical protein
MPVSAAAITPVLPSTTPASPSISRRNSAGQALEHGQFSLRYPNRGRLAPESRPV